MGISTPKNCTLLEKNLLELELEIFTSPEQLAYFCYPKAKPYLSLLSWPLVYNLSLSPCPTKLLGSMVFSQLGMLHTLVHEVTSMHHLWHLLEMKELTIRSLKVIPFTDHTRTWISLKIVLSPLQWLGSLRAQSEPPSETETQQHPVLWIKSMHS